MVGDGDMSRLAEIRELYDYHRGQVVTMLRQLGAEAPATDLILFYRRRQDGKG
jgi:hypothetical protein